MTEQQFLTECGVGINPDRIFDALVEYFVSTHQMDVARMVQALHNQYDYIDELVMEYEQH